MPDNSKCQVKYESSFSADNVFLHKIGQRFAARAYADYDLNARARREIVEEGEHSSQGIYRVLYYFNEAVYVDGFKIKILCSNSRKEAAEHFRPVYTVIRGVDKADLPVQIIHMVAVLIYKNDASPCGRKPVVCEPAELTGFADALIPKDYFDHVHLRSHVPVSP